MIKLVIVFLASTLMSVKAENQPGFLGCGEYLLKGVLVKNTEKNKDNKDWSPVIYKVNAKTSSEMRFLIKDSDDLVLISSYLEAPTEIKAQINKAMDGTRGEIDHIKKVALRKSNPLLPLEDSGIFLITPKPCRPPD